MARSKAYTNKVYNRIDYINKKARAVEKTFGLDSEQYQRYINATTAALPAGSYKLTESGRLSIPKSKENLSTLKVGQLNALTNLPTAAHSMETAKQAQARNQLRVAGNMEPTTEEIKTLAEDISDEEALQELAAKSFIQRMENAKGKLKYSESVKEDMQRSGAKTYRELQDIIKKGQKIDETKERKRDYMREYRERNREEINRKQREYRAANKERVNQWQRDYRRRKKFNFD